MIEQTYYEGGRRNEKRRFLAGLLSAAMILTMTTVTRLARRQGQQAGVKSAAVLSDEELGEHCSKSDGGRILHECGASLRRPWNDAGTCYVRPLIPAGTAGGGNDETYPVTTSLTWNAEQVITGMRVIWWADNAELQSNANVTFEEM